MKGEDSDLISLKSIMTSPIITLPSSSTVRQATNNACSQNKTSACY